LSLFIKLCGIRTSAELETAVELGVDAVGFVLTPSPRQLPLYRAAELRGQLPDHVLAVAVFHDPSPQLLRQADAVVGPDLFQAGLDALGDVPPDRVLPVVVDGADLESALGRALEASTRRVALIDGARKKEGVYTRDVHSKAHGCVNERLTSCRDCANSQLPLTRYALPRKFGSVIPMKPLTRLS